MINKVKLNEIKQLLKRLPFVNNIVKKRRSINRYTVSEIKNYIETAKSVTLDWPDGIEKPTVGIAIQEGQSVDHRTYWTKFVRFLEHNKIPYSFIYINKSTFIKDIDNIDILLWHTSSNPTTQHEAESKIKLIEKYGNKVVYPSTDEIWFYEDKIRQNYLFDINNLPSIKTFISFSYEESLNFIDNCNYPIVSKISTGSGSQGVKLISSKSKARRLINKVFNNGLNTYWPYQKQHGYVYFQEFIKNATYDLRIIIIGNNFFGYYRNVPKNDFRASGAGDYTKKSIPREALLLAKTTKDTLPKTNMLAVDLLYDLSIDEYKIIETSVFIGIDSPEQLVVDGVPGYYSYENETFTFKEGKYWMQELVLYEIMMDWIKETRNKL